jgi:hypothetical protein
MASRTAKVASSIVAGFLAGIPLSAPYDAANAAECLTSPRQDSPQGQHWYYRIDHANNNRHCWYLRDEGGNASEAAPSDDSSQAPKPVMRTGEVPPHSLEDAHAEFPAPQPRVDAGATTGQTPAVAPSPLPLASNPPPAPPQGSVQDDTQGSAIATRWPSQLAAAASTTPAPVASESAESDADAAAPPPAATPVPAPPPPALEKPSASLQMLFAVIIGALALAGLTASIIYRLGRGRRLNVRQRRAAIWEGVDSGPRPPWVEPAIEQTAPRPSVARNSSPSVVAPERYEKIEEILAQLVKQAQQSDA